MRRAKRALRKVREARSMLASAEVDPTLTPKLDEALGLLRHVEEALLRDMGRGPTARERREGLTSQPTEGVTDG